MKAYIPEIFMMFVRAGLLWPCLFMNAHAESSSEYAVKAAFLYNFAVFTEWPEKITETFSLCVLGNDPFGDELNTIEGKQVGNAKIIHRHLVGTGGILRGCNMLYIASSEQDNLPAILDIVRQESILTISELPDAARQGVMIELDKEANKITFKINLSTLRLAKLDISSKLLRLAQTVY